MPKFPAGLQDPRYPFEEPPESCEFLVEHERRLELAAAVLMPHAIVCRGRDLAGAGFGYLA